MATSALHSSVAGPSTVPAKRVAGILDTSDDEQSVSSFAVPNGRTPNGTPNKSSHLTNGKKKKSGQTQDNDGARRRRKGVSERLFLGRQQLPFYQGRTMILEEIMAHDTTIIIGETGCGKSTQLPQLLRTHAISLTHFSPNDQHASRFSRGPCIAITQPRRLPTIALANRVSEEMGCQVGGEVGYTVRFDDSTGDRTKIRYLTEGVLMRELANGNRPSPHVNCDAESSNHSSSDGEDKLNLLLRYDAIIIDEAHERTLYTDFLCGALKRVQRIRKRLIAEEAKTTAGAANHVNGVNGSGNVKGKGRATEQVTELKIVVMSATLDPGKFQRFFETGRDALLVKGRMYNVATRHILQPVDDFIESAAQSVMRIHVRPGAKGDALVFMPGADEIESCCELLRRMSEELPEGHRKLQVLPLYASLGPAQQAKIFGPNPVGSRRVIVATNIAETSITIPGVSFVVDTGYKKEKEYIFRTSGTIEYLAMKAVSKAAAQQRTGRAGRERSGECYRLFSKSAFDRLQEYDQPEITRCNLASAVLQLIAMRLDPFEFEYIDNPGREPIAAAFQTLAGLGAISSPTSITSLGRSMFIYPLDPAYARILLASFDLACPNEVIDVVSLLVAGPVWIDRSSDREAAAQARAKFLHRDGDHLTALSVFRAYVALRTEKGERGELLVKWAKDNHVNSKTFMQAIRIRDQLRELAERDGKDWKVSCGNETGLVVRSLLQGLFMNTAVIQSDGSYRQTAGSLGVKIHPSSVLMSKRVPAILYDELTITNSIYARNVSSFDQQWLSDIPWFRQSGTGLAQPALNLNA